METNKLSQRLLGEGWSKDQTPPGCNPWNQFYGGWTYDYRSRMNTVFETPCGLLLRRTELGQGGSMGYMGIEWMEENDNATIICPYYDRDSPCKLNHPVLEAVANAGCHYENLHFCAVHETGKVYSYESSAQQVRDLADQEMERRWQEFSTKHKGRVCKNQCQYDRSTKKWMAHYFPEVCAHYGCRFCNVLQVEIDTSKRGNVFFDEKSTWKMESEGMFDAYEKVTVVKGKRLYDKTIPLQICEAIVKYGLRDVKDRLRLNRHSLLYFNPNLKIEFINFRAEKKVGRDLLQDLNDVANGVTVFHEADQLKQNAEAKRQRREAAADKRIAAAEKKIVLYGLDSLTGFQRERMERLLGPDRCYELDEKHRTAQTPNQISFFEEIERTENCDR